VSKLPQNGTVLENVIAKCFFIIFSFAFMITKKKNNKIIKKELQSKCRRLAGTSQQPSTNYCKHRNKIYVKSKKEKKHITCSTLLVRLEILKSPQGLTKRYSGLK